MLVDDLLLEEDAERLDVRVPRVEATADDLVVGIEHGQPDRIIGPDTGATPDHPRFGQTGWCNGCAGYGNNEALEANYHVTVDDVGEFADFLAACGGFEIH